MSKQKKLVVPADQWPLPVGMTTEGQFVSLKQYVLDHVPALLIPQLPPAQRSKLVAFRIGKQAHFEVATIGSGVLTKERAIAEVQALTPAGLALIDVEQRMIRRMIERAEQGE
jgi:hypothetical protein